MKSPPSLLSNLELLGLVFGVKSDYSAYRVSLKPLFDGSRGRLQLKCAAARELVIRWMRESLQEGSLLSDPSAVRDYLSLHFAGREHEAFMVLYLDAQNRLLGAEELFRGTLTQTAVYPREILKCAMRHNAAGVIFAHNHPSGLAKPSTADRQLTETLQKALALVDIKVLDHFIVAGSTLVSFAERGWL
ncbi:MAG: DNA repair protein RadC [Betaproteobacteria bacterium]|nr:DNA repair protein RadC [Betaproteobacteria bacterium]